MIHKRPETFNWSHKLANLLHNEHLALLACLSPSCDADVLTAYNMRNVKQNCVIGSLRTRCKGGKYREHWTLFTRSYPRKCHNRITWLLIPVFMMLHASRYSSYGDCTIIVTGICVVNEKLFSRQQMSVWEARACCTSCNRSHSRSWWTSRYSSWKCVTHAHYRFVK